MFWRKKEKTCPNCGAHSPAESSYCRTCLRSLVTMPGKKKAGAPRVGKAKVQKEIPGNIGFLMKALAPAGFIMLFLFFPVGVLLLILSSFMKKVVNKAPRGPCPHCNKETVAFFYGKGSAESICLHCRKKFGVDTSSEEPVFVQLPNK
jgi:hypothetical protein